MTTKDTKDTKKCSLPDEVTANRSPLAERVAVGLRDREPDDAALGAVLDMVLNQFDCAVGTIHALSPHSGLLELRAYRGLPESLLPRISSIPIGKGMAGLAAERRQPVQVCNLQSDASGAAQPHAKETKVEGSIAVPMLVGDSLRGVLGVATPAVREFSEKEVALLTEVASTLGRFLGRTASPTA